MNYKLLLILTGMGMLGQSCRTENSLYEIQEPPKKCFESVMVAPDNPLFTRLGGMPGNISTKSSDGGDLVSLESLLDRTQTETLDINGYHMVQIPFVKSPENSLVSLTSFPAGFVRDNYASISKKYLIEVRSKKTLKKSTYVVAMVPTNDMYRLYGEDSFSFLDKTLFEGVVIFSTVHGSFRWIKVYSDGPIFKGNIIAPSDSSSYDSLLYVSIADKVSTKCDVDSLEASYCIGYIGGGSDSNSGSVGGSTPDPDPEPNPYYPNDEEGSWWGEWRELDRDWIGNYEGGGGGGGGSSNETLDPAVITETKKVPIDTNVTLEPIVPNECKVTMFVSGNGYTYGSGSYKYRSHVICRADPDVGWHFDRWVGDFGDKGPFFSFNIEKDCSSTAYFEDVTEENGPARPCFDKTRNLSNPMKQMRIARTSSGRLIGGTYGWTRFRNGENKFHSGLDLYAEPGTEIYAMIDGVIGGTYVVGQPNRDKKGNFPAEYIEQNKDINDAGNRISLRGKVDGKEVEIGHWHLQSGTPVAENPRTGEPYAPGDIVYRGELIAYSGRTGNAYNVPEPHLHLSFKIKNAYGNYVNSNPEELINGKVDWSYGNILDEWIKSIICDSDLWDPDYSI